MSIFSLITTIYHSHSLIPVCHGKMSIGSKVSPKVSPISQSECHESKFSFYLITVPIILKGVQRWEDALKAYDLGCAGVVLSNHGGRQLDFARSGIEVLVEVTKAFREKRGVTFPNPRFQLFVDGGVRRATDVLKAVALGATAGTFLFEFIVALHFEHFIFLKVGIGRPFLYAYSSYGQAGVDKALEILHVSLTCS